MPAFQSFSPLAGPSFSSSSGLNLNQQFTGASTQIDGLPAFATADNVGGSAGAIAGGSTPATAIISGAVKAARFGLQAYSFANTLSAISDYKKGALANFARMRQVVREQATFKAEQTEQVAFRLLKRQTAQSASGGFAVGSGSTLAILNRTETEKDRAVTQINKQLDDALFEITKRESEVRRQARGLKTKAIVDFASTSLNFFSGG